MSSGVQVYISGRRHATVHSRVIRRVVNIRGALTHQVQHQNKLWAAHTPRSDHCGVQYHARKGRLLRERSTAVDIGLSSPLDNLEIGNAFPGRFWRTPTRSYGRTPRSEEGFIRVLKIFFFSICLPWCIYFGVGRLCLVGDAAALEKREGWQLGSPLPSHSAPRWYHRYEGG